MTNRFTLFDPPLIKHSTVDSHDKTVSNIVYVQEQKYQFQSELYNSGEIIKNLKNLIQKSELWSFQKKLLQEEFMLNERGPLLCFNEKTRARLHHVSRQEMKMDGPAEIRCRPPSVKSIGTRRFGKSGRSKMAVCDHSIRRMIQKSGRLFVVSDLDIHCHTNNLLMSFLSSAEVQEIGPTSDQQIARTKSVRYRVT